MTAPITANKVITAIQAGELDKSLVRIGGAVAERMTADDGPETSWKITVDGAEVTEDDITVEECTQIELLTDQPWTSAVPGQSAIITRAYLVVAYRRAGLTTEKALKAVGEMTAADAVRCLGRVNRGDPTDPPPDQ